MKLEQQVSNYELSKRLNELGVKQTSLVVWLHVMAREYIHAGKLVKRPDSWKLIISKDPSTFTRNEWISAFTVAELGAFLPDVIKHDDKSKFLTLIKNWKIENHIKIDTYAYYYIHCPTKTEDEAMAKDQLPRTPIYEENEADARARCLIYLMENKFIS